jgi:beta-glucosidase
VTLTAPESTTLDERDLTARGASVSLAQKVRLLTGADFWSLHPEPAVGLRRIVVSDGPAGVRGERWDERDASTNVPSATGLAATWNEDVDTGQWAVEPGAFQLSTGRSSAVLPLSTEILISGPVK